MSATLTKHRSCRQSLTAKGDVRKRLYGHVLKADYNAKYKAKEKHYLTMSQKGKIPKITLNDNIESPPLILNYIKDVQLPPIGLIRIHKVKII